MNKGNKIIAPSLLKHKLRFTVLDPYVNDAVWDLLKLDDLSTNHFVQVCFQISPKVVVSCRILIHRGKEFFINMVNMFIYSLISFFLNRAAARVFFTRNLRSFAAGLMTSCYFLGTFSWQENCTSSTLRVSLGDLLGVGFEVISHSTFLGVCWVVGWEIVVGVSFILLFTNFGVDLPAGKLAYAIIKIHTISSNTCIYK